MVLDPSLVITWILFIALFPIQFYWYRRAYRIFINKDFSEVALKNGISPERPDRYAIPTGLLNLAAGAILSYIVIATLSYPLFGIELADVSYDAWSAVAGSTIWMKLILDFLIRRQAHLKLGRYPSPTKKS